MTNPPKPLTPGTSAGEADRAAPPPPALADQATLLDEREKVVAEVFAAALGRESVGVHEDFFACGGHSLGAALAVARVSDRLGVPVPMAWLREEPTVAGLVARIARDAVARPAEPQGERHPGVTRFPMVGMQWNLWMVPQLAPGGTNTIGLDLRISGLPGTAAVQAALDGIVARHEVLRTRIEMLGEWPMAVVKPAAPVQLAELDVRGEAADKAEALSREAAASIARKVFSLDSDVPLLQATLVWTGERSARLAVAVDHFAFDGYSAGLFVEELAAGIAAAAACEPDPTPEPALQVGDVGLLQGDLGARPELEAMRVFWRAELAGSNSPNLPGTLRDKWPTHGRRLVHRLDGAARARLQALETACGTTRFAVFAAALAVVLREATGTPDNLLGAMIALRDRPGMDRVIGPLIDMVPVRLRVPEGASFRQLAAVAATAANRSLAHKDLGIAGIMQCGDPGQPKGLPLTPIVLSMQPNTVRTAVERGGVRVELAGELDTGSAMCDIAVMVNDTAGGLQIHFMYDIERFERGEIEAFRDRLIGVLDAAATDPDQAAGGCSTAR